MSHKSRIAFEKKAAPLVKTGGMGSLADRYVRFLHREGGQTSHASCALAQKKK